MPPRKPNQPPDIVAALDQLKRRPKRDDSPPVPPPLPARNIPLTRRQEVYTLLRKSPSVALHLEFVDLLLAENAVDDARTALKRACSEFEDDPDLLRKWESVNGRQLVQRYQAARQRLRKAADATVRGEFEQATRDLREHELTTLKRRVAESPKDAAIRLEYARALFFAARYGEAAKEFERLAKVAELRDEASFAVEQCRKQA